MNNDHDLIKAFSFLDGMKPGEVLELKRIPEDRRTVLYYAPNNTSTVTEQLSLIMITQKLGV